MDEEVEEAPPYVYTDEDPVCRRCEIEYHLRDGCERTPYCDRCAHNVIDELTEKIVSTHAALRAAYDVVTCSSLQRQKSWSGKQELIVKALRDLEAFLDEVRS